MATTASGTPYVESSDLVANYPAVSEALAERVDEVGVIPFADSTARGTAIPSPSEGQYSYLQDTNATEYWDGSAWVAAGVAPGLVHINTTTFSAVSSVSLDDVFTSEYENYLIIGDKLKSNTANEILIRLRAGGVDATGSNYYGKSAYITTVIGMWTASTTAFNYMPFNSTGIAAFEMGLYAPQISEETVFTYSAHCSNSAAGPLSTFGGASHRVASSYDGFTIYGTTGTITGTIRVYGYENGA
jgi:hypothetical protein